MLVHAFQPRGSNAISTINAHQLSFENVTSLIRRVLQLQLLRPGRSVCFFHAPERTPYLTSDASLEVAHDHSCGT